MKPELKKFINALNYVDTAPVPADGASLCIALDGCGITVGDLRVLVDFLKTPDDGRLLPNSTKREWVNCPVCGDESMRKETDKDGDSLILCTNYTCGSNGGDNFEAVQKSAPNDQQGWQPIATVPKDGERFLVFAANNPVAVWGARWISLVGKTGIMPDGGIQAGLIPLDNEKYYTHWHPLPEPPETNPLAGLAGLVEVGRERQGIKVQSEQDSFAKKQAAYEPVHQKWVDHIGPFPAGYQVAAEHVGWLSFCEGVEYGKKYFGVG